jgi:hypothetical protein
MSITFLNDNNTLYYLLYKSSLLFFPLTTISIYAYSQFPAPLPASGNGMQKVLIIDNGKTGRSDTIKLGTFIKLWFWSDKKRHLEQPIIRTDFQRHTYYIESNLIGATDSELVFLKRPPYIPLPIPLKISSPDFDTVKINEIRSIRPINRSVDGAVKGAVMMPALSVMPEYFTTFPQMLLVMPAMQAANTFFGDAFFPFHRVNHDNNNYTMHIGEIPADTLYYIRKRKMTHEKDYEWEIERLERYDKMYTRIRRDLTDQLLDTYLGNKIISITLGGTFIPGFNKGNEDQKTRLSIIERKFFFGISTETFITERHRIGLEIQMNKTERFTSITGTRSPSISASAGNIISNFSYFKWGLGGLYSRQYKERKWAAIRSLDEEMARENDETTPLCNAGGWGNKHHIDKN